MNKSTPINQLPSQQIPQQMPELLNEDDSVIQDVLNNLNSAPQPQQSIPELNQQVTQDDLLRMAALNNMNINQLLQQPQQQYTQQPQLFYPPTNNMAKFNYLFSNEFKLAGIVFMAVIIVHLVPFNNILSKYVALDKIPYHDILVKAILVALAVIIVKKLTSI
jgi:hypothetical protein